MSVLIMREYMLFYEEIYTTGKNFTLFPALTEWTNLTSDVVQGGSGAASRRTQREPKKVCNCRTTLIVLVSCQVEGCIYLLR